jgi:hypothetical protein
VVAERLDRVVDARVEEILQELALEYQIRSLRVQLEKNLLQLAELPRVSAHDLDEARTRRLWLPHRPHSKKDVKDVSQFDRYHVGWIFEERESGFE